MFNCSLFCLPIHLQLHSTIAAVMGEKKNNRGDEKKRRSNHSDEEENKDAGVCVALKVEMHCDGCARKIIKHIRSIDGVESVKRDAGDKDKVLVTGKVDPDKLREMAEQKTKKKVELGSPMPSKEEEEYKDNREAYDKKGEDQKQEKMPESKRSPNNKQPQQQVVLRVNLDSDACIEKKVREIAIEAEGYEDMSVDRENNTVTVKGAVDEKALVESVNKRLRKVVDVIPANKQDCSGGEKRAANASFISGGGKYGVGGSSSSSSSSRGSKAKTKMANVMPCIYKNWSKDEDEDDDEDALRRLLD